MKNRTLAITNINELKNIFNQSLNASQNLKDIVRTGRGFSKEND